jgi:hypothetical protein
MVIYKLKESREKEIEKIYNKSAKELEKFYEIKLKRYPNVIVIKDRNQLKTLLKEGSEWIKGFSFSYLSSIFVLDKKSISKNKKMLKDEDFRGLIKHELSHAFYHQISSKSIPAWLSEGTALYTDGRLKYKKRPERFVNFLNFEKSTFNTEIYKESGFVVETLVKLGKIKLLKLIKTSKEIETSEKFYKTFKKIYGFELNYENINKIYLKDGLRH